MQGVPPGGLIAKVVRPVERERERAGAAVDDARAATLIEWRHFLEYSAGFPYNLHHFTQTHAQFSKARPRRRGAEQRPTTAASQSVDALRNVLNKPPRSR